MPTIFDRLLSFPVLIAVNVGIILATETVGGGVLFYETGIIHGIAVLFIVLAVSRLLAKHYLFDPELRILLRAALAAYAVFALSHFVEFASYALGGRHYTDAGFANVVNFYTISLLLLVYGAERVIGRYRGRASRLPQRIVLGLAAALAAATVLFLFRGEIVSFEPEEPWPYGYAAMTAAVWSWAFLRWRFIRRIYPWFNRFLDTVLLSTFMIFLATLPNIFYEHLEGAGVEEMQSIYMSHFTFYAALSVMILAFTGVNRLGGLHKDLREQERAEEARPA